MGACMASGPHLGGTRDMNLVVDPGKILNYSTYRTAPSIS